MNVTLRPEIHEREVGDKESVVMLRRIRFA